MRRLTYITLSALIVLCAAFLFSYYSPVSNAQIENKKQNQKFQFVDRGNGKRMAVDKDGIQRLKNKTNGKAEVKINEATGAAGFINFGQSKKGDLSDSSKSIDAKAKSAAFFNEFGSLFGINNNDVEMRFDNESTDSQGSKHQNYNQFYKGIPVFAGMLKTHFDKTNDLYTVNGTSVPQIEVDTNPLFDAQAAALSAIALVEDQKSRVNLSAENATLYVYRTGLIEGVPGNDYLAYKVEVTNGLDVREFVFIDAHSNKVVDQFTGIYDALNRRAFNGNGSTSPVPPTYPNTPFWVEGQPFPTGVAEADNMLNASGETYNFYKNAFGRDSFNGAGAIMDSIFNRGNACPNASWNGVFISFCPGLTTDDVTSHEWSHAYTEYTHGLIYQWQPGALNEAYSDIFGETVDRINNRDNIGNSETDPTRANNSCTVYSPASPRFYINAPQSIAGQYGVGTAAFGPGYSSPGVTANVVLAMDASNSTGPSTTDGCTAFTNAAAVAGKIALIDRGTCGFKLKTLNAQNAGATGVIIANVASSANSLTTMANDPAIVTPITIPAVQVLLSTGNTFRGQLNNGLNASITATNNSDASTRWLLGEDSTAAGLTGALRDMYNPTCYGNPGKVSDTLYYVCSTADQGGVHTNSGIPNHAYALLVDGGTYNGQTVGAIGLTKAAHIYFRAQAVYQNPATDFAAHAFSLAQAANDLIGVNLSDLVTGAPSGQVITASDVAQLEKAMLAVEMRNPPVQCNFQPLLGQNPPADPSCGLNTVQKTLFADNFEGSTSAWTVSRQATSGTFTPRDWSVSSSLPDFRAGSAFFAPDPNIGNCTPTTNDETGVLNLTSPSITLPVDTVSNQTLTFDHWVALEAGFDGGQLLISVNGGGFTLVPQANFIYNAHNVTLASAAQGNTNPRRSQRAWSGSDAGSVDGSWGKSMVNLTGLASPGDTIQLRWDMSTDACGGSFGWYVDNVRVFACLADADNDGVSDAQDQCPDTNTSQTKVIIGSSRFSQTGVGNTLLPSGCTLQQKIDAVKAAANNHGGYVSGVNALTNEWVALGIITNQEKAAITRAVAQDK